MMGLFDTHAHLYDKAFDRDREEVIHHIFETLDYVVIPKTLQPVKKRWLSQRATLLCMQQSVSIRR